MLDLDQNQAENDDKPKQAAFRQVNADDNPIDEHGKTKRDYEIEKAQEAEAKKRQHGQAPSANRLEENDRTGQRNNPVNQSQRGEFHRDPNKQYGTGQEGGDPQGRFNAAAADLDPRNQPGPEASRRPPQPGVDKIDGGSSEGPGGLRMGSEPDVQRHPLPNPNNPDSPNNPASTATRDMLARQTTPPLPVGERTTSETRFDGKSEAQLDDEAKRKDDGKSDDKRDPS